MAGLTFWLVAGAMALAAVWPILRALRRGVAQSAGPEDARIYGDQMHEIARDATRGLIDPDEAGRLRTEVARRLLQADRAVAPAAVPGPAAPVVLAALALVAAWGVAGYLWLGAPGYPDLPLAGRIAASEVLRAARPAQAEAEAATVPAAPDGVDAEFLALMETLRARLAERPDDVAGLALLAQNEARLGRFAAAQAAQGRVVALKGAAATAADHVLHARLMIAAADGAISPEADAALALALHVDPRDPDALFLAGLSELRLGRADRGFVLWRRYLESAPPGHPWQVEVQRQIGAVAAAAGVDYVPPEGQPDAAAIRGMVEGLADRLAAEGGPAADWAQLIRALGVLGEIDRARAIRAEALGVFAGRSADLALIRESALAAGVAE